LNAYARQFIEQMEKPDVDSITGIPPAVAIEQRMTRGGGKSTVATVTEIFQFLRLLYAKLGDAYDPETGERAVRQSGAELFARMEKARGKQELTVMAPLIKARKGFHAEVARWAEKKGYPFLRADGKWVEPAKFKALDRYVEHSIEVVLGNVTSKMKESERRKMVDTALALGRGTFYCVDARSRETIYSTNLYCPGSGQAFDELDPRLFSFNSVHGWCANCQGYGTVVAVNLQGETEAEREVELERAREQSEEGEAVLCPDCQGARLNPLARAVRMPFGKWKHEGGPTIIDLSEMTITLAKRWFATVKVKGRTEQIARDILPEIQQRLEFLEEVGLGYLTLGRAANTLSGGESQRIRLAAQLGSNLQGVLYVLDEPTIGLHPRDNARLLDSLDALKAKGNTLVVVEHDEDTMRRADRIIDLGPGAGVRGGEVMANGSWREVAKQSGSVTGRLLGEKLVHPLSGKRREVNAKSQRLWIEGATANNLQGIDVGIPLQRLTVVCGVSGSGKSTLLHDVLKVAAQRAVAGGKKKKGVEKWKRITGADVLTAVYEVDQSPIGKTSRSTPGTYIGIMDDLRALFSQMPLARQRGYTAGRFSFNSGGGRCESCQGQGAIKVEMNFLPSVEVPCDACGGKRFNRETLEVLYNGKSMAEVLAMSIDDAVVFFAAVPRLHRPLELLQKTGLGYLTLGQRSPTLSGGEAQRIKLVAELSRSLGVNTEKRLRTRGFEGVQHLYLLEEPTIGLHLADVQRLLTIVQQLVDAGHTVVVIEHHLDVIAEADWVIELGPEGGEGGGRVVAEGSPEKVATVKKSATAPFLAKTLR
jgi:excinuclease ABC subunit A